MTVHPLHLHHVAGDPRASGDRPSEVARATLEHAQAPLGAALVGASPSAMGRLELKVYRKAWLAARAYHRHEGELAAKRAAAAAAKAAHAQAVQAAEESLRQAGKSVDRRDIEARLGSLKDLAGLSDHETNRSSRRSLEPVESPPPGRIAVRLMFAQLFDGHPDLVAALASGAPVILVDLPDSEALSRLRWEWKDVVFPADTEVVSGHKLEREVSREEYGAIAFISSEPIKAKERSALDQVSQTAVQAALPIVGLSPAAETHCSKVLLDVASARLTLPRLDGATITKVIRIVTGKPCREVLPAEVVTEIGLHELVLAVRFDRSPAQCLDQLRELAARKTQKKAARDLTLDELHGLEQAVRWGKSVIRDVAAWKRGEIGWDAIDHGVVLDGPPGTGKTTFAQVFAAEAGLPLITGTLAKWQAADEGHLGHLLRAMCRDFDEARAKAPAVMFIDEVDAFPIRSSVKHSHKDYVIEVVNGFLEQLDGLAGRQGVIFIAACNDTRRCDPAILRPGRLNRIIDVNLPTPAELERMFRVRLRGELAEADLTELSLLAIGSSGAEVERIVKDARRAARHGERALTLDDLLHVVSRPGDGDPPELLRRSALHEAGHILVDVLHRGPDGVHAVLVRRAGSAGSMLRLNRPPVVGTHADLTKSLQILLAGRAAEEIALGAPGQGAGGTDDSDLASATKIAAAMCGSLGHAGPHPLVYLGPTGDTEAMLDAGYLRVAVHQELAKAYEGAKAILVRHRHALERIADHLLKHRRIAGAEVFKIMERCPPQRQEETTPAGRPVERSAATSEAPALHFDPAPALADGFADPIRRDEEREPALAFGRARPPRDPG